VDLNAPEYGRLQGLEEGLIRDKVWVVITTRREAPWIRATMSR
jgi:hypothetical protein